MRYFMNTKVKQGFTYVYLQNQYILTFETKLGYACLECSSLNFESEIHIKSITLFGPLTVGGLENEIYIHSFHNKLREPNL